MSSSSMTYQFLPRVRGAAQVGQGPDGERGPPRLDCRARVWEYFST
jgi:hypothetical protein